VTKLLKSPFLKHDRLFFICPISLKVAETNEGLGYEISQPRKWMKDHSGLVKFGLFFLKLALVVSNPTVFASAVRILGGVSNDTILSSDNTLDSPHSVLYSSIRSTYNEERKSSDSEEPLTMEEKKMILDECLELAENHYHDIEEIVRKSDSSFAKTGLIRVTSNFDGSTAWIMDEESVTDYFNEKGKDCLIYNKV